MRDHLEGELGSIGGEDLADEAIPAWAGGSGVVDNGKLHCGPISRRMQNVSTSVAWLSDHLERSRVGCARVNDD
jgi:hypothetical protein